LAWPAAITAAEKLAAIAQLKSLGILVRKGV
ncbi:MAG: head decoration protein, partial [Tepidimonas sp.]